VVAVAAQEAPLPEVLAVLEVVAMEEIHRQSLHQPELPILEAAVAVVVMTAALRMAMAATAAPVS
jgi:hypothetical protein